MELLTGRANSVYLDGEASWGVTANWTFNGEPKGSLSPTHTGETWTATLPYILQEGVAEVTWSGTITGMGAFTTTNKYFVVTPYLTRRQIREFWDDGTDEEIDRAEAGVRHIINAHTGQTFGKFTGTKLAVGNGENTLTLPARLISFTDITLNTPGLELYGTYQISGDGWYLKPTVFPSEGYTIKSDITDYTVGTNGVIYNPYGRRVGVFQKDVSYAIDGVWGYESIPEAVVEAAKLLVNDYAANDSIYRDRYLESLTSPDWRIQFHSGAFRQTGNVRADQLLANYVLKRGWAVI